jgi:hypothetical protein
VRGTGGTTEDAMDHQSIFLLILLSTTIYALVRGGAPERIGALILLAGAVSSVLLARPFAMRFRHIEPGILLCDMLMFASLVCVALRSTRFWPIWVSGLVGSEIFVDLLRAVVPALAPDVYMYAIGLWSWAIQTILFAGVFRHQMRLRRFGSDDPWKIAAPEA